MKEDGAYVKYTLPGGADPVLKKLGSGNVRDSFILMANSNQDSIATIDHTATVKGFSKITYKIEWKVGTGSVSVKINNVSRGNSTGTSYTVALSGSDTIIFSINNSGALHARIVYTLE